MAIKLDVFSPEIPSYEMKGVMSSPQRQYL